MAKRTVKQKKKKSTAAKVFTVIGSVVVVVLLLAAAYAAYLFLSYHRIPDMEHLKVQGGNTKFTVPLEEELTVTSYNIGFGAYSDDFSFFLDGGTESWAFSKEAVYENIAGAMDVIEKMNPTIALFQEVDFDATRSYHVDECALVEDAFAKRGVFSYTFAQNFDSPFLMYPITQPHGINKSGIMTISSVQITEGLRRSLPVETGPSRILDYDRCYMKSRIPTDNGKELVIYNFHLSAYTEKAETAEIQLSKLLEDMQEEYNGGNYCIAGGDFNRDLLGNSPEIFHTKAIADNWAKPVNMSLFTDDITLVVPYDEKNPAASCRYSDKPFEKGDFEVTVDGFIKSANVDLVYSNVIETDYRYSDHNPVFMKCKLAK